MNVFLIRHACKRHMRPYMQYRAIEVRTYHYYKSRTMSKYSANAEIDPVVGVLSLSAITSCQYVVHLIEHHGQTFQYFLVLVRICTCRYVNLETVLRTLS
jgi:hypothetical protein